jgi:hypothetical protein
MTEMGVAEQRYAAVVHELATTFAPSRARRRDPAEGLRDHSNG